MYQPIESDHWQGSGYHWPEYQEAVELSLKYDNKGMMMMMMMMDDNAADENDDDVLR